MIMTATASTRVSAVGIAYALAFDAMRPPCLPWKIWVAEGQRVVPATAAVV
jgi:hypothetical protein